MKKRIFTITAGLIFLSFLSGCIGSTQKQLGENASELSLLENEKHKETKAVEIAQGNISSQKSVKTPLVYNNSVKKSYSNLTWEFILPSDTAEEERGKNIWMLPGDAIFVLDSKDLVITPAGHKNLYDKNSLPKPDSKGVINLENFAVTGFIGVLKNLEGAGYVVLLEEFAYEAPMLQRHNEGFIINNCGKLRVVFFQDGGYIKIAEIIREWMKEKNYYRNIFDKPFAKKLAGAVALRSVQHGAIGKTVWDQVTDIIPKAFMIWRTHGTPSEGLEKFTVELQKELDQRGDYYFLPWCGTAISVTSQETKTENDWFAFDVMPQSLIDRWKVIMGGKIFNPEKGSGVLFCPFGLKERMEYWVDAKMVKHPNNYRIDGVNIDTMTYWLDPLKFIPCEDLKHPAGFAELVEGMGDMLKTIYDRGGIISHEGGAFYLEKYAFASYGRPMTSIGSYADWYLNVPGADKKSSSVLDTITRHVPINELVYHDQIAMRLHDAESLNMRYATDDDTEIIRRYKFVFNALYGLTPNVQLGGKEADKWLSEDVVWLRKEIPKAIEIYTKIYGQRIIEHKFLTTDKLVQQSTFENGIRVTANFDSKERTVGDIHLEPISYIVDEVK